MMINKRDYIWLERHTEINNICTSPNDCAHTDLALKVFRPNHLEKLKQIFADKKQELFKDADEMYYLKIKGYTIDDYNTLSLQNNGKLIYNIENNRIYYATADNKKYKKIFRQATAKLLNNLSNRKKLDILFSLSKEIYVTDKERLNNEAFLLKNSDKILALLQMKIPEEFIASEKKKVKNIVAELSKIPNIKQKINTFANLSSKEQQELILQVSKITAKENNIDTPEIYFLTTKEMQQETGSNEWIDSDAYTFDNVICINKDKLKEYDGISAIIIPFHETNHIAQAHGDYSQYPEVEEMFCHKLNYLENIAETYIFVPQELITYEMERHFTDEVISQIRINYLQDNYLSEHNIVAQYVQKSMQRKY